MSTQTIRQRRELYRIALARADEQMRTATVKPTSATTSAERKQRLSKDDVKARRDQVAQMHREGATDPEMAAELGVARGVVAKIRARMGLYRRDVAKLGRPPG